MATNNKIDVIIDDDNWAKVAVVSEAKCCAIFDLVRQYLTDNNVATKAGLNNIAKPLHAVLNLSNAEEVQRLNAEFRNMDRPTNVLSFANIDSDDFTEVLRHDEVIELGDIIMAWEVLRDEAMQKAIASENHFIHLLVHGLLHLLGFDHQNDDEAEIMEGVEIGVLKLMNIDNPYEE